MVEHQLAALLVSAAFIAQAAAEEPKKPSPGEFAVHGAESCTWLIALTDAEEWINRGQPKELFRCDGIGIKKLNASVEGRLVDGTVWLHDRTPNVEGRRFLVVLDLMDQDRVINNAVENPKRFDLKRGNVLKIKIDGENTEREGYDIYATEQFDPSRINLRITVTPQ